MGCKGITSQMVSLAKKLEGKPFHLIASDCQGSDKDFVISHLKSNGLEANTPNFTVTQFGEHETVKSNGFAPYYILFDHRGEVFYHYKCGRGHGGDGLKFVSLVEKLVEDAPVIYTGKKRFKHINDLAAQVSAKQNLPKVIGTIRSRLIEAEESEEVIEELQRLYKIITNYRDDSLKNIELMMATEPENIQKELKLLLVAFKKTTLGEVVKGKLDEMKRSKELKESVKISKKLKSIRSKLEMLKACKTCKRKGSRFFSESCSKCQQENIALVQKVIKQLKKAIDGKENLPITKTVTKYIKSMQPHQ